MPGSVSQPGQSDKQQMIDEWVKQNYFLKCHCLASRKTVKSLPCLGQVYHKLSYAAVAAEEAKWDIVVHWAEPAAKK